MSDKCPHHHADDEAPAVSRSAPQFWRSLEELSQTPAFEEYLHREFPSGASVWNDGVSRRNFLSMMGASIALAGLSGCYRKPEQRIVPYVIQPEQMVAGKPQFYATAMPLNGYAHGCIVEQNMGRPTKVEGNVRHPSTLGGTDVFMQSAPLQLCDPNRSQIPRHLGNDATWGGFAAAIRAAIDAAGGADKVRLRILTENITSPTLIGQMSALQSTYKQLRWHRWQPFNSDNARLGGRTALGKDVQTIHDFSKARRILSLDADFLSDGPGNLRYAMQWASGRRVKWKDADLHAHHTSSRTTAAPVERPLPTPDTMSRMYVVETGHTITGAKADHRLPLASSEIESLARDLAARIAGATSGNNWIDAVAEDLQAHRGSSLIIVGDRQPLAVHALAHAMNESLGNVGATVNYFEPVESSPELQIDSLRELTAAMNAGEVDVLLIVGGNPVFTAPADIALLDALQKVPLRIHLSPYLDETGFQCHWHLPESHFLEMWGDIRGHDGTASIIQPLIAPLYSTKSAHEVLAMLAGETEIDGHAIVQDHWRKTWGDNFEQRWLESLRHGVIDDTASPPAHVKSKAISEMVSRRSTTQTAEPSLELNFRPDPCILDGRFANIGWLQECPRPITKLTWDNAALISPATAKRLGVANEAMIRLEVNGRALNMPALIVPGHPERAVTVHCGYGRERGGRVASGAGFNVYPLRASNALYAAPGLKLTPTAERYPLATTQNHQLMEGRDIVRLASIHELQKPPAAEKKEVHLSLYPEHEYRGYKWGMVIDQTACIGCNACVVACQSENNIPVVGKDQVLRGREMHWLRIDTYFTGGGTNETEIAANAEALFQPMMCQHCENAPCEYVCPVYATTHSEEGLNEMTYNRCVGTRYCSNNCPYKVRRFNFYRYSDPTPSLAIMRNPEVTVRTRGVMEKCTYCVQRINRERTEKKIDWVKSETGEVQLVMRTIAPGMENSVDPLPAATHQTACQQACPTEAIVFGDINDAGSYVHRLKHDQVYEPIHYGLLTELNTAPRTTYLSRLSNPNPKLREGEPPGEPTREHARLGRSLALPILEGAS